MTYRKTIDFRRIADAARPHLPEIVRRWLPAGRRDGALWRCGSIDGSPGQSLAITVSGPAAGRFCDFADDRVRGGDAIALAAAVFNLSQVEAARRVADMLGIDAGDRQ
jgi:hypothetical protein